MNILALDDEAGALKLLVNTIKLCEPEAEIYSFNKSQEALDFAKSGKAKIDIAFLDIQMPTVNGLDVAKRLKAINGNINIIFTTGFSEYAVDAMKLRSSGYIMKPVTKSDIETELSMLRHPVSTVSSKPYVKTFGNFDIFVDGKPVEFKKAKAKELLAYLIDRNGSSVNRKEIAAVIFEDEAYTRKIQSYITQIIKSLKKTLSDYGMENLIYDMPNAYAFNTSAIDCDLSDYLNGDPAAINRFTGEYMTQYYWAEDTLAKLYE